MVEAKIGSPIPDTSEDFAPAAAIKAGLSGLLLARLPFLECCTPWTMLVCRLCDFESASRLPGCNRGESVLGKPYESGDIGVRPAGDVWSVPPDRRGFTVAFQPSVVSMAVKRSPGDWATRRLVSKITPGEENYG